jgi:hypothetical protein
MACAVIDRSFPCNVPQFPIESILMSNGESLANEKPRSSSIIWFVLIPKSKITASAHNLFFKISMLLHKSCRMIF